LGIGYGFYRCYRAEKEWEKNLPVILEGRRREKEMEKERKMDDWARKRGLLPERV
jgi:hypothetical protein